jgi:hypothetical protein
MYRSVLTGDTGGARQGGHLAPLLFARDRSLSALSCMDYSVGRHKLWNGKYIDVA